MTEQRNLILAIVLSVVIVLGFQFFYERPRMIEQQRQQELAQQQAAQQPGTAPVGTAPCRWWAGASTT